MEAVAEQLPGAELERGRGLLSEIEAAKAV
jgi:hypothetical protein